MLRKKKKPSYDLMVSMEELLQSLAEYYGIYDDRKTEERHKQLNHLADEYNMNQLKVLCILYWRILIDNGFKDEACEYVCAGMH